MSPGTSWRRRAQTSLTDHGWLSWGNCMSVCHMFSWTRIHTFVGWVGRRVFLFSDMVNDFVDNAEWLSVILIPKLLVCSDLRRCKGLSCFWMTFLKIPKISAKLVRGNQFSKWPDISPTSFLHPFSDCLPGSSWRQRMDILYCRRMTHCTTFWIERQGRQGRLGV